MRLFSTIADLHIGVPTSFRKDLASTAAWSDAKLSMGPIHSFTAAILHIPLSWQIHLGGLHLLGMAHCLARLESAKHGISLLRVKRSKIATAIDIAPLSNVGGMYSISCVYVHQLSASRSRIASESLLQRRVDGNSKLYISKGVLNQLAVNLRVQNWQTCMALGYLYYPTNA
jgi:hypothetical protein